MRFKDNVDLEGRDGNELFGGCDNVLLRVVLLKGKQGRLLLLGESS